MYSTTTIVHARENFADFINQVAFGKERIVLKRHNKSVMAMVPLEDLELLEALEEKRDIKAAKRIRKEIEAQGTVPWEDVKRNTKKR